MGCNNPKCKCTNCVNDKCSCNSSKECLCTPEDKTCCSNK